MLNKETKGKVVVLENFCNDLMDAFLGECDYNDFNELSLLEISQIVDKVGSKYINKLIEGENNA